MAATHPGRGSPAPLFDWRELRLYPPASLAQWAALLASLGLGTVGVVLATHHPLSGSMALAAWVAMALAAALFWVKTPVFILAPLPLLALAPWSGWITFEELDLCVTACGCGGYLAYALRLTARDRAPAWRHGLVYSPAVVVLILALAASTAWSMRRGFADAGGFEFGWFQGYHEPMNSLRQAKAIFLVLALVPLWTAAAAARPRGFSRGLMLGLVLALAGGSAAALWERLAYTGLLDFSTDYRSTALFWEMHVGGAALDGFLLLTLPFAVLALLRTRSPLKFLIGLGVVLLAAYACLTTFSRGVYLALPLALLPMVLLADAQRRRAVSAGLESSHFDSTLQGVDEPMPRLAKIGAMAMAGAFALAAALVFGGGGYRGLMALFGVMVVLLTMPASLWLPSLGQRFTAVLMGGLLALLLGAASWALSMAVPKAAYVLNVVALLACGLLRWRNRPGLAQPIYTLLVTTAWFWLLATMVIVADYWGGTSGRWTALLAGLALAGLWAVTLLDARFWPLRSTGKSGWRQRALLVAGLVLVMSVVAALGGGAYLRDRVATWKEDGQVRVGHWRDSLHLLHGGRQWLMGRGTGRFVATNFYQSPVEAQIGDYRLRREGDETFLALTGGMHMLGRGEQFRVSQRVTPPAPGKIHVELVARTAADAALALQLCEKNLIYPDNCFGVEEVLKPLQPESAQDTPASGMGHWTHLQFDIGPVTSMGGDWWAPRFVTFSMSLNTQGARVDIARIGLRDAAGRALLINGDFNREMAHWFFSSDRYHLPWHIKNVALHVLFEQGLIGLTLLGGTYLVALARLAFGRGRDHPLAPAIVAALIGFAAVGTFDSLLDVPRVGFIFFTLLLLGLGLRAMPDEAVRRVA
jgi:hypothetical protein